MEAKRAFKRFSMRVRRAFPQTSIVWRMEYQERGAIHFHLLCFNLPYWSQKELQKTWEACTGESRSIVDIRLVHGARSVMAYVSKYIAKASQTELPTSLDDVSYQHDCSEESAGRFWGYINKELLPLGQKYSGVLIRSDVIKNLSKLAWALLGSDNPYHSISFHLFDDKAQHRLEVAVEEGGMYSDEWNWSRDFTERQYRDFAYQDSHFSQADYDNDYAKSNATESRPRSAGTVQPCTQGWTSRSSFVSRAER